jgi:catecholate siderophore receptor
MFEFVIGTISMEHSFMSSYRLPLFLLFVISASFVLAQAPRVAVSTIHGTVSDPSRARIAGSTISARPAGGGVPVHVVSDQNGEFVVELIPGEYEITVARKGFAESTSKMKVVYGPAADIDLVLSVAGDNAVITVVENAPYISTTTSSATKTITPVIDVPQSLTVVTKDLIADQMMTSIENVVRYVPGITAHQGENNRDQVVIRGNSTSADFYVNGIRDDVQYYRDLYNLDRVEALKGPNAMIFGRGGAGGVINRVTKEAGFTPIHEFTIQGGAFKDRRFAADLDQPLGKRFALRLNGMYEGSDSFRDLLNLERYGVSPTLTFAATERTRITASYENFHDHRVADRGLPSFQGRPIDLPIDTYIGDPNDSRVRALVNIGTTTIEHVTTSGLSIQNRASFANYDRGYQNYVPGVVTADKTQLSVSAYNNATNRRNIFDQTDVSYIFSTGPIRHTLMGGVEGGHQITDNFRNTGYFNNTSTSILVPLGDTVIDTPVTFRQSATDANNHLVTNLGAAYLQDQVQLTRYLQLLGGVRFDYFDLQFHNNNSAANLQRIDHLLSPRAGIVIKPADRVSVYGSYSVSYLPSSGDQFSSLTNITQQLKPEMFTNYELGVKWDLARSLSLTTAAYQLNRTNTRSTDPNDPSRIIQTGSSRTNGYEIGVNGNLARSWQIAGGYAYQDAYITSATASAIAGAQVAMVPHHTFSLWNSYQFMPRLRAGVGVTNRSDMFAAVDNTVVLPGYTRTDTALFYSLTEKVRLQVNVENLFNKRYYLNADSNSNISPGSSRAIRAGMTLRF